MGQSIPKLRADPLGTDHNLCQGGGIIKIGPFFSNGCLLTSVQQFSKSIRLVDLYFQLIFMKKCMRFGFKSMRKVIDF